MDKHLQVVQLCVPWLSPKDVCLLKCTCRDLNAMRVSWAAHKRIAFRLDGSPTTIAWLHKNIASIRRSSLKMTFEPPKTLMQGLFADGRALTNLAIRGCLEAMPVLPAQLQHLRVSGCRHLRSLPPLPGTLQTLHCSGCGELTALHKSLASTAVTELICSSCEFLWELPDLPVGLKDLCVENCTSLRELPELPPSLASLRCSGCNELKELPELTHTELTVLHISVCKKLTYIPDLPEALDYLTAAELPRLTQLPALPGRAFKAIHLANSNIVALPDPLPFIDMLICKKTRIRRLPPLAGCEFLCLDDCQQLQQLPKQLPDDLRSLNLAGCAALQQLPAELPSQLTTLDISGCTALQQLPARLPMSLVRLNAEGCSSLQQLPALAGCGLKELRIKGCVQLRGVDVAGCGDLVVQFD